MVWPRRNGGSSAIRRRGHVALDCGGATVQIDYINGIATEWNGPQMQRFFASIVAPMVLAATPLAPVLAGQSGEYTFTVLRDGDPVGTHRFAFEGDDDRVDIAAATDIEVRFAFVPVFQFQNQRRETWQDGEVVSITSQTNDNGKLLDISVEPNGHGYLRTVNGRVDHFDPSVKVLGFWDKDVVNHRSFFSVVEDKTAEVTFERVGWETVQLTSGGEVEAEHYRMLGDIERDVWFDRAGHVAKVTFDRHGSTIEYVRNEAEARQLDCSTSELC
jgi:hypothetical protein